jgi:hypothetical protein
MKNGDYVNLSGISNAFLAAMVLLYKIPTSKLDSLKLHLLNHPTIHNVMRKLSKIRCVGQGLRSAITTSALLSRGIDYSFWPTNRLHFLLVM